VCRHHGIKRGHAVSTSRLGDDLRYMGLRILSQSPTEGSLVFSFTLQSLKTTKFCFMPVFVLHHIRRAVENRIVSLSGNSIECHGVYGFYV
jgi:hypothetical protein